MRKQVLTIVAGALIALGTSAAFLAHFEPAERSEVAAALPTHPRASRGPDDTRVLEGRGAPPQTAPRASTAEAALPLHTPAQDMLVNAPAQSTPGAPPDLETIRERSADAEARLQMHVDTIAANFGSEIRDQRWSTETAESLRTALASEPLASTPVESIDCRTTTCRVELQDDGSGAVLQAIPMLAVQMGGTLPNLIAQRIDHPNGRAAMVLYMSR